MDGVLTLIIVVVTAIIVYYLCQHQHQRQGYMKEDSECKSDSLGQQLRQRKKEGNKKERNKRKNEYNKQKKKREVCTVSVITSFILKYNYYRRSSLPC